MYDNNLLLYPNFYCHPIAILSTWCIDTCDELEFNIYRFSLINIKYESDSLHFVPPLYWIEFKYLLYGTDSYQAMKKSPCVHAIVREIMVDYCYFDSKLKYESRNIILYIYIFSKTFDLFPTNKRISTPA